MSLCSFSALSDPLIDLQMISHDTPYRTPFNWNTSWQLTAALEGTYRLHAEEREILLNPGDWVLLSPMVRHDFGSSSRKSVALQVFFRRFPPELLPEFAVRFNYKQKLCRTGRVEGEKLCAFAAELKKLIEEDSFCKRSQATVFGLNFIVALLADLPREPLPSTPLRTELKRVLELMEEHFSEPIGIADFAEAAGLSESRFAQLFRRQFGVSPMAFFNRIRLGFAEKMLLEQRTIEETAAACGFASAQYFCRFFRKSTGVTPGTYRNELM